MMYHLTPYRPRLDDILGFAIFPVRNTNFVKIENQFSCTSPNVFIQTVDCSVEERSRCLQTLLFLRDAFRLDDLLGLTKNKQIDPPPINWNLELIGTVMLEFLFRDWRVPFGVLSNPVKNVLFAISIQILMLSSISGRLSTVPE
jgi:hypothetical protein